jgi:hypothetical protein
LQPSGIFMCLAVSWENAQAIYVLEFYTVAVQNGDHRLIQKIKRRAKSLHLVEDHARSLLETAVFNGVRADGCTVKDQIGKPIAEVCSVDARTCM